MPLSIEIVRCPMACRPFALLCAGGGASTSCAAGFCPTQGAGSSVTAIIPSQRSTHRSTPSGVQRPAYACRCRRFMAARILLAQVFSAPSSRYVSASFKSAMAALVLLVAGGCAWAASDHTDNFATHSSIAFRCSRASCATSALVLIPPFLSAARSRLTPTSTTLCDVCCNCHCRNRTLFYIETSLYQD